MKKLFLKILISFLLISIQQTGYADCTTIIADLLSKHERTQKLPLKVVPRKNHLRYESDFYPNAFVQITSDSDITEISKILAVGKSPFYIEKKIKQIIKKKAYFKDGIYLLPLRFLLPKFPKNHHLKNPSTYQVQANCFNAAFCWNDPDFLARHYDAEKSNKILKKLYSKIEDRGKLQYGDLIIVRNKQYNPNEPDNKLSLEHAAIYINDELIWRKPGMNTNTWHFDKFESLISSYYNNINEPTIEFYRRKTNFLRKLSFP